MLTNYQTRPMKIAGIIDGLLNNEKFSGIGRLQFLSMEQLLLDNTLSGYTLTYVATHDREDAHQGE